MAVTQDDLDAFLLNIQSAFYAGDLQALHGYFRFPLVVYTAAGIALLHDPVEFKHMAQDYRNAITALSAVRGRQTILARDAVENNRLKVTVRNVDLDASGTPVTGSTVRYYLEEAPDGFIVEMLEYLETSLSLSDVDKIIH